MIPELVGQSKYVPSFKTDTMSVPETNKVLEGRYVETVLRDQSEVRFFETDDHRYFVRFIVTRNFYFDKVAMLEIQSGSKSSHEKDTKQYKVSKTAGMFFVEVYKNYFTTYKESGITAIVFGDVVTDFSKQDVSQVKKMATFFHESITKKN